MKVKESRYVLPQVLEAIRAELPDVILYDSLALWAQLVSQILHVPAILCCPTYVKNVYPMFTSPQKVPADTPPSEGLEDIQADLTDLCTSYHLPPLAIRDTILHPEALNIVFMPRAFHPAGETIEESYLFVGPSIAPRQDASPFLVDQMAGQPILYISLGTAFNNRPDFFNLCFQAFADQPWHVIMAHGKKIDLAALDTIPQNFQLAPYVPQLEVLQQASVFVTHAGMNSTMESLYYGVPMVLVPQMFEQAVTARRCDELGLGIALDPDTLTAETLRTAVEQVHHTPSFHENVQAMQQTVRAAGGYQRAADAIINFVRSQH